MNKRAYIWICLIVIIINGCSVSNEIDRNEEIFNSDLLALKNKHIEITESNIYQNSEINYDTLIFPGVNDLVFYFSYRSDVENAYDAFWGYNLQFQIKELDSIELKREYSYLNDKFSFKFYSYNAFSQKDNDDIASCTIQFIDIDTSSVRLRINLDVKDQWETGEAIVETDSISGRKYIKTNIASVKDTVYRVFNNDTIIIRKTYTS